MARNREYWSERFEQLEEAQLAKAESYVEDLDREYRKAVSSVEKDIAHWYQRFADNNEISMADAQRLLKANELEEFKWTVEEYVKYGQENSIDQRWLKELENASAKVHISRLEAIKLQLRQQAEILHSRELQDLTDLSKNIYSDTYYRSAFEIQKGLNVGWAFAKLDDARIDSVISKPWAADGKNFSSRIWQDRATLIGDLETQFTQLLIRGESPDKVIREISKKFNTSRNKAGRLVMTESAFFASAGQKDCFNELGVEKYEIIATLDMSTSEICRALDGKVFLMSVYAPGSTAPPFHCWCRSVTAPWFEDEDSFRVARAADGKTYYVSSDMKYGEWYDQYVKGDPAAVLAEKKAKNTTTDKAQLEKYKSLLGKDAPKSLAVFQEIKHNNPTEYGVLKAQVKGMGYYNQAVSKEPAITRFITETASATGMKPVGLQYRLKGKDSFLRKIRSNYDSGGNEYEIKDILRYTYTASPQDLTEKTLKSIEALRNKGYNTIEIKNTWVNKNNPYKGINTTVISPVGQKFELQYHTPESFALKDGKLHELYEKQRMIVDDESDEFIRLQREMQELSKVLTVPDGIEKVKLK